MTDLRLGFCSHAAATFACKAFHYSRSLPASKRVHIGAWEDGHFIGAIVFSRGGCRHIARPFGLTTQAQACELTRIALNKHVTPVSRILAIALRLLWQQSPGLKIVVSYSDPQHGHDGRGVYAAGNWLYIGLTNPESVLRVHGRLLHPRTVGSRFGHRGVTWLRAHIDPHAETIVTVPKHKYVFAFDADVRARLLPLARPYPPRRERSEESVAPATGRRGHCDVTRSLIHSEGAHG